MQRSEAIELMRHAGTGNIMASKKVRNNTYLIQNVGDPDLRLRLHATDIITWHADGTMTFDSGGWLTVTTKERMNSFGAPYRFHADRGEWYVSALIPNPDYDPTIREAWIAGALEYDEFLHHAGYHQWSHTPAVVYFDGMTLDPMNPVAELERVRKSPESQTADALIAQDRQTKREINAYLRKLTAERWSEIYNAAANDGAARGDCFMCQARVNDADHLRSHIAENYHMVSMAYNAVAEAGYREPAVILAHGGIAMIRRALKRYLEARLLVGASSGRRGSAQLSSGFVG